MPNPIFQSTTAIAAIKATHETDDVTIMRRDTTTVNLSVNTTMVTVYAGKAGLQEGNGSLFYTPNGPQEQSDALAVVSNNVPASLPPVLVDDILTRVSDGKQFVVVATSLRTRMLPHLEMQLKHGVGGQWRQQG